MEQLCKKKRTCKFVQTSPVKLVLSGGTSTPHKHTWYCLNHSFGSSKSFAWYGYKVYSNIRIRIRDVRTWGVQLFYYFKTDGKIICSRAWFSSRESSHPLTD